MAKLGLIFYAHTLVSMISLIFKIMLKEYASHVMFRGWIINGFDSYKGPLCVFIVNGRNCFTPKYDTLLLGALLSSFTQLLILNSKKAAIMSFAVFSDNSMASGTIFIFR